MDKNFNDIDKLAREAFENFETAYNPEDWKLMEEKLNKKEHLMPYIWLYKGTEILVFLLIIFTAFNFWQSNKESNENLSELSLANSKSHNSTVIDKTNVYNQNNATAKGQDDTQIGSSEKVIVNNSNNGNLLNANQASKSSTKFNGLNDAFDKSVNSSLTNETSFKVNIINIPTLSFDQKKLNPGDGVEEGKGFGIKTNFKFPKIYRRQQRATFYAGADVNFNNSLGQGKLGLSIGALIEQEISDRFAVRSGLIMNRKAFEKVFEKTYINPIDENSIIQSEINQKSTLVMISLPVFLNTVLYRDEKWKVSLSTGFAAGMLTNRIVTGTQRSTVSQLSGSLTNISQLNSGSYPKGVLQGGLAAQNFFMSAAIGADVERQLGDRITLFVQPMFSQNLNKIEGNEMYRQLSLNAGIKTVIR
jgi:hypothetical protein